MVDYNTFPYIIYNPVFKFIPPLLTIPNSFIKPSTRHVLRKTTASCRLWQLEYILMSIYNDYSKNKLQENIIDYNGGLIKTKVANKNINIDVNNISKVIANIFDPAHNSPLYNIILLNKYQNEVSKINNISQLIIDESKPYKNFPMCVYLNSDDVSIGTIFHYFTIIYANGQYFLNSSYGSDYVSIPQYTTPLSEEDFNKLCEIINGITDIEFFKYFFNKYFLQNGLTIPYSEDDIENDPYLRYQMIFPSEGREKELAVYTENMYKDVISIGLIKEYNNYILDEVVSADLELNYLSVSTYKGIRTLSKSLYSHYSGSKRKTIKKNSIKYRIKYKKYRKRKTIKKI
jgi:hypothetical protein